MSKHERKLERRAELVCDAFGVSDGECQLILEGLRGGGIVGEHTSEHDLEWLMEEAIELEK
jgi:hypothetical protein